MLIAWVNRVDSATLSAGSEINSLPVTLLQDPHLRRRWHTAGGVNSTHVLADLGAALAIDVLALLGTNLTSAAELRVRASTVDPTAVTGDLYDSTQIAAGVDDDYGAAYHVLSSTVTARYWRVDIEDLSLPDNVQVGRAVIAPAWSPTVNHEWGWGNRIDDRSEHVRSKGGQVYIDEGPRPRVLEFSLSWMDRAEMYGNAFELMRAAGRRIDVLVMMDPEGTHVSELSVWGLVQRPESLVNEQLDIYRHRYLIEERL